jgi:plasmid stabilization system protein ParE
MKFTVVWVPSAERDLADLWNKAPDRAAVTAAADTIDALLGRDPLAQGEAREGARRLLFVEPLAVYYDVNAADRRVTVHAVWRWPA